MKKVSVPPTNDLCPQTLFVYGTTNEDGTPNFGLFCWFSYCWLEDLGVMCAIGSSKRTLSNIRRNGVFSANLVTEAYLPLADYFGTADGRDADKMSIPVEWEASPVLQQPILCASPMCFELEVKQEIATNQEDATVFLCSIRNVLKDEALLDEALSSEEKLRMVAAVSTSQGIDYWSWDGRPLGKWHEPAQLIKPGVEVGAAAMGN